MIAAILASNALRYVLALSIAFGLGYGTQTYRWHNEKVKLAAVKEVQIETNKQILHAAENQIVFAETKRDVVRTEYRDRLRDITIGEAEQYRAVAPDRGPSDQNTRRDETDRTDDYKSEKEHLIDLASVCYAGVSTIREQLKSLIQAEESMRKD